MKAIDMISDRSACAGPLSDRAGLLTRFLTMHAGLLTCFLTLCAPNRF